MELRSAGENAIIAYFGHALKPGITDQIRRAETTIRAVLKDDLVDLVPSYASLLVLFDPLRTDHMSVRARINATVSSQAVGADQSAGRTVVLPVYYASEVGWDLDALAVRAGLTIDQVVALHSAAEYRVYAIGFAPGFAYLGEVDKRIAAPRLPTPRQKVPRGAVAIADRQTAVYPAQSPGGWNLIGRCPVRLFDPNADPVMPVEVGDRVRFEAIERDRFLALGGSIE